MFQGKNKEKIICLIFGTIIVFSLFLRVYKFDDWLFLKSDQVRDAIMVSNAHSDGPSSLPLLGPRAGGTMLRLGPIFYYFQYASSVIFDRTDAPVFAYPNLLFSLLVIPLFYLFLKKYFSRNWSMALTAVFSFSFLSIEYSRFAWNPNSIPFFNLLFFYSLLQFFDQNDGRKTLWAVMAGLSLAISTQLHFSSFVVLPVILGLFLIFNFRNVPKAGSLKALFFFLGTILVLYVPVIWSDIIMKGDNMKEFFQAIGSKPSSHSIFEKLLRDVYYFGKYYFRILTGYFGKNSDWFYAVWILILGALARSYWLIKKENDKNRLNFLVLADLWFLGYFLVYIPLAYTIDKPRFFLPLIMTPAIFLGFLFKDVFSPKNYIFKPIIISILAFSILSNLSFTLEWFREMNISESGTNDPKSAILEAKGKKMWWNWWHFEKFAEFASMDCEKNSIYYITSKDGKDYDDSLEYAFKDLGDKRSMISGKKVDSLDQDACYYYLFSTNAKKSLSGAGIARQEQFGDMSIARFSDGQSGLDAGIIRLKDNIIEKTVQDNIPTGGPGSDEETSDDVSDHSRIFWKDIFK